MGVKYAPGVVERILDDYPQAALKVDVSQSLPVYPITTQYRGNPPATPLLS